MTQWFFKQRFLLSLFVFLSTVITFYVGYVVVIKAPLTPTNHFGFVLYGFIFGVLTLIFTSLKTKVASFVFVGGWFIALLSLIFELINSLNSGQGTLGAALGLISTMIIVLVLTLVLELIAQVVVRFKKK